MTQKSRPEDDRGTQEPGRTPGQAEGTEKDVDQSMQEPQPKTRPTHAERDYQGDEPGRTPGQSEG